MSWWRDIGGIVFCCGLLAGAATADGHPEWWWVHQETVAPAHVDTYEQATATFLESIGTTQDLRIRAFAGPEGVYTFLATLADGSGPEAGRSFLDRIHDAKSRRLAARGLLGNTGESRLLVGAPEISHLPTGAPRLGEGTGFFRLTFLHVAPGKARAALGALRRLSQLHRRQAPDAPFRVFRLRPASDPPVLVLAEIGASPEDLLARRQEVEQRLGARGRGLHRQLQGSLEHREAVEGTLRRGLSYPLLAKVTPLEPFPPEPEPPPEPAPPRPPRETAVEPLAPLPPEPLPEPEPADEAAPDEITPDEITPDEVAPDEVAPDEVAPDEATPDFAAVEAIVDAWATAWSEQRVDDYLGFYADTFDPGGGRREWEAERRRRLTAPSSIEVLVEDLSVDIVGPRSAVAEFTQTYRSDTYGDVVRKRLELEWEDGDWRIVREEAGDLQERGVPDAGDLPRAPGADDAELYIVVATVGNEPAALRLSSDLRAAGYPSEVFRDGAGAFVVTLDHLPRAQAQRRRDEAVRTGHAPRDAYLVSGVTFEEKISP